MADYVKIDGVAAADIVKINTVAVADIAKVSGADKPASGGASLWCLVGADGGVATAAASDLNAWTCYVSTNMGGTQDYNDIAYGKDGSGNPLWVVVTENGNREARYSSDPTNTTGWSDIGLDNSPAGVAWGNNVWMACGGGGKVYRSTAGTTGWSLLDLSGVTGWASDVTIYEIVSDGAGSWMFAQGMNVFLSTNDGVDWARVLDLSTVVDPTQSPEANYTDYKAYTMAYTASRWCVYLRKTSNSRIFHAAASDTSTWTPSTANGSAMAAQNIVHSAARRMAAADGTVIIVDGNDTSRSTDGGQDWIKNSGDLPRGSARAVATDGQGNWITVHDSGRVSISTNNGDSWTEQTGDQSGGNTNMRFPTGGGNVENLDAIAANVYLPL